MEVESSDRALRCEIFFFFYLLLLYLPVLPATHEVAIRERTPIYFVTREENENVHINIEQQLKLQHAF